MRAVADVDTDLLGFDERFDHCAQSRQNAIERIREANSFPPGPGEPGSSVRFPFRWHAVPERGRSFQKCIHRTANVQQPALSASWDRPQSLSKCGNLPRALARN